MDTFDIFRLKEISKFEYIYKYYLAIFGPGSIVLVAYFLRELFYYLSPSITPTGIDGITYFGLQTVTIILILSHLGVIFLRIIGPTRKYLRTPWDLVTPPFRIPTETSSKEVDSEIIRKAQISSVIGLGIGIYLSFLFPLFAFVPWRQGTAQISVYRDIAPDISIPEIISQIPILSDLTLLSQFIASPDAFGYLLLSIIMTPIIVGFWNLTYLFLYRDFILTNSESTYSWFDTPLKLMPPIGLSIFIMIILRFGIAQIL